MSGKPRPKSAPPAPPKADLVALPPADESGKVTPPEPSPAPSAPMGQGRRRRTMKKRKTQRRKTHHRRR